MGLELISPRRLFNVDWTGLGLAVLTLLICHRTLAIQWNSRAGSDDSLPLIHHDAGIVELTDPWAGTSISRSAAVKEDKYIRSWADRMGVPVIEIDPVLVDTTIYAGWYTSLAEVPISNSVSNPVVIEDLNRNGKAEIYGSFKDWGMFPEPQVYEISSDGIVTFGHSYAPNPGVARLTGDVDQDSLSEVLYSFGGDTYDYEQEGPDSLPVELRFVHDRYQGDLSPGHTGMFLGLLDGDRKIDFVYKGSEYGPSDPPGQITKVYVTEYDPDSANFVRIWSTKFDPIHETGVNGFAVDDFDRDGLSEFVVSESHSGQVFVTESTGDNMYATTWSDSTPFANLEMVTSGDVDGDGIPEFFVGAAQSSSNWILVYEAVGNDSYHLILLFYLHSGGLFDIPFYRTADMDGDGRNELIVMSGPYLYVFTSASNNEYKLHFLMYQPARWSFQVFDITNDGLNDIVISKIESNGQSSRWYSDVYVASGPTHVESTGFARPGLAVHQNYPNPSNGSTRISYRVSSPGRIRVAIYDALGQEISILVDRDEPPGQYSIDWTPSNVPSGVYFFEVSSPSFRTIKKMLILK